MNSCRDDIVGWFETLSLGEILDFLMMPMIYSTLVTPLGQILGSITVDTYLAKIADPETDVGSIGFLFDYLCTSHQAQLAEELIDRSRDIIDAKLQSERDPQLVASLLIGVGYTDLHISEEIAISLYERPRLFQATMATIRNRMRDFYWDSPDYLLLTGLFFGRLGQLGFAREFFERVLEIDPENDEARHWLNVALEEIRRANA